MMKFGSGVSRAQRLISSRQTGTVEGRFVATFREGIAGAVIAPRRQGSGNTSTTKNIRYPGWYYDPRVTEDGFTDSYQVSRRRVDRRSEVVPGNVRGSRRELLAAARRPGVSGQSNAASGGELKSSHFE